MNFFLRKEEWLQIEAFGKDQNRFLTAGILTGKLVSFGVAYFLLMYLTVDYLGKSFPSYIDTSIFKDLSNASPEILSLIEFLQILISIPLLLIFWKFWEKRNIEDLGFDFKNFLRQVSMGCILGILLITPGFFILLLTQNLRILSFEFPVDQILPWLFFFFLVAFFEELIFRGYVLSVISGYFSVRSGVLLSSLLFSLVHLSNPDTTTIGLVNIFLVGIINGVLFIKTGNLWAPMGAHWTWNFFQGIVYGFDVSGFKFPKILRTEISGPEVLTGGEFGLEGSILVSLLFLSFLVFHTEFIRKPNLFKTL